MKKKGIIILMLIIVASGGALYGQEKKSKKQRKAEQTEMMVKNLIDSQNYIFTGTYLLATGDNRNNESYLIVTKERIETSTLPQHSKDNSIVMKSVFSFYEDFEYEIEKSEKGSWNVYIKIEIEREQFAYEMFLKVYPSGKATLTNKINPYNSKTHHVATYKGRIEGPKPNGKF